jgi:threonine 3-dehydrogenase
MRAVVKPSRAPGLKVTDVPKPTCGPSDVLIAVRHAGVCGTDLHIADWDEWAAGRTKPPFVVGHEFAGEVVEVGRDVKNDFQPGQLVTAEGHIVCGHCRQCRTGNGHICQRTQIIGVDRDGAFAEFIAMPAINVMALDGIPTTTGAIMDPLGNAFHTVLSAEVSGSTVLVLGCGPIGCFAVGIARAAGAAKVFASDVNATRLALACRMGAHETLNPATEDVVARVMDLTGGEGADLVCEMSGHPDAIRQAFRAARLGGRVHLLGLPKDAVSVNLSNDVIFKGLTVYGVVGRKIFETWHQMRSFLASGQLDPTPVVTHQFPLSEINRALEAIRSGEAGKVILEIGS